MRKSTMITECWTPQRNHRDTFSLYIFFQNVHIIIICRLELLLYCNKQDNCANCPTKDSKLGVLTNKKKYTVDYTYNSSRLFKVTMATTCTTDKRRIEGIDG